MVNYTPLLNFKPALVNHFNNTSMQHEVFYNLGLSILVLDTCEAYHIYARTNLFSDICIISTHRMDSKSEDNAPLKDFQPY